MSNCLRSAEHGIKSRQPRRFEIAQALPPVVRVVGDDERAEVVVRHVARENDLAAERVRDALLEELRGIGSLGEVRRLANRAIASDEFDVPVARLAKLALGSRYVR